jgi:hypothetical protein
MAEYESLFLGQWKARKMGVKLLKVEGYSELVVNQVKMESKS